MRFEFVYLFPFIVFFVYKWNFIYEKIENYIAWNNSSIVTSKKFGA